MDHDVYSPCPCGSGKKLKWCCHTVRTEMQRIEGMIENEQTIAALKAIDSLKQSESNNPWVLTTQARLLLQSEERDKATDCIDTLLKHHPEHPSGLSLRALDELSSKGPMPGLVKVQEAVRAGSEKSPQEIARLLMATVSLLTERSQIPAAGKHLELAAQLDPSSEPISQYLHNFRSSLSVPPLLKERFLIRSEEPVPEEHKDHYQTAITLAQQGAWHSAAEELDTLSGPLKNQKDVWLNLGLCYTWTIDNDRAIRALRKYIAMETDFNNASRFEALAQSLENRFPWGEELDAVRLTYSIDNPTEILPKLEAHDRFHALDIPAPDPQQTESVAEHPEAMFSVLDRPIGQWQEDCAPEDLARSLGEVLLYNQTAELPARFILQLPCNEQRDETQNWIEKEAGVDPSAPSETETIPNGSGRPHPISVRWQIPDKTPRHEFRRLTNKERFVWLTQTWSQEALEQLDGLTPAEAARKQTYKASLGAMLLVLEQEFLWETTSAPLQVVRKRLGLPAQTSLEKDALDPETLPLSDFGRLSVNTLSDDQLLIAFQECDRFRLLPPLLRLGDEMLNRPTLENRVDLGMVCAALSNSAHSVFDTDAAIKYTQRGREFDKKYQRDLCAFWDLNELPIQFYVPENQSNTEKLLNHIVEKHGQDPSVQQALAQILQRFGLLDQSGELIQKPESESILVPGDEQKDKLWLPEQEQAATEKPKLWVPGDD